MEKPEKRNSCSSWAMIVGAFIKKFVGGDTVILKNDFLLGFMFNWIKLFTMANVNMLLCKNVNGEKKKI